MFGKQGKPAPLHPSRNNVLKKLRCYIVIALHSATYLVAGLQFLVPSFFVLPPHLHTCAAIMAGQGYDWSLWLSSMRWESHVVSVGFYVLSWYYNIWGFGTKFFWCFWSVGVFCSTSLPFVCASWGRRHDVLRLQRKGRVLASVVFELWACILQHHSAARTSACAKHNYKANTKAFLELYATGLLGHRLYA